MSLGFGPWAAICDGGAMPAISNGTGVMVPSAFS
jgi:hypothetical protein